MFDDGIIYSRVLEYEVYFDEDLCVFFYEVCVYVVIV